MWTGAPWVAGTREVTWTARTYVPLFIGPISPTLGPENRAGGPGGGGRTESGALKWVLFEGVIGQSYSARLGKYGGQTVRTKATRAAGKDTVVSSDILGQGAPTGRVDWRVRGEAGNYKVVDIIIGGVSMVITQRDEFASVIRRSGGKLGGLLARLRAATSPGGGRQASHADIELTERTPGSIWEK